MSNSLWISASKDGKNKNSKSPPPHISGSCFFNDSNTACAYFCLFAGWRHNCVWASENLSDEAFHQILPIGGRPVIINETPAIHVNVVHQKVRFAQYCRVFVAAIYNLNGRPLFTGRKKNRKKTVGKRLIYLK